MLKKEKKLKSVYNYINYSIPLKILTRSVIGGWVLKRFENVLLPEPSGLDIKRWAVAGLAALSGIL